MFQSTQKMKGGTIEYGIKEANKELEIIDDKNDTNRDQRVSHENDIGINQLINNKILLIEDQNDYEEDN